MINIFYLLPFDETNDLKWGDFSQIHDNFYENNPRNIYGKLITEEYLRKYKIKLIISGHQDTVPHGFLIKSDDEDNINKSKTKFELQKSLHCIK